MRHRSRKDNPVGPQKLWMCTCGMFFVSATGLKIHIGHKDPA